MATKTLRVFAEYTSTGFVPMPTLGNIDYGYTLGSTFPATTPTSFQTDNPDLVVTVTAMTDFYVWIRVNGQAWNPSYTRNVRVYPDSPNINNVVMNMIIATGPAGVSSYTQIVQTSNRLYFNGATTDSIYNSKFAGKTYINELNFGTAPGLATVATSGAYADLTGKPTLATVATSGLFTDLSSKPSGTAPLSYNSGTNSFVITQANTSTNGFLSSTDWNTFNNKFATPAGTTLQYVTGNGTLATFPLLASADKLVINVRNSSGVSMPKGSVVYINGATGNKPTIALSQANSDATSAQTLGLLQATLANNAEGNVVIVGSITDLNTSAFSEGQQLYLSPSVAGAYTATKQYAPNHLVYVGVVARSHVSLGVIEVKIQNGYEMDELHDVSAQSPSNNDGLFYNTTTGLWEKKSIATVLGYTPYNGTDTSIKALFSATTPLSYSNGVYGISQATTSSNGYLSSTDWNTFNSKGSALNGTGFVKVTGTTISYDNTSYLPLSGGLMTNSIQFSDTTNLKRGIYGSMGTDDNWFIGANASGVSQGYLEIATGDDGTEPIYVTQYTGNAYTTGTVLRRVKILDESGNSIFPNSLTANNLIMLGGTSSQFLKANGTVDNNVYLTTSSASSTYLTIATAASTYQTIITNNITGTGTINELAYFNTASTIASLGVATYPSLTELSYVKGVTSAIQTQINTKQATISLTTTGTSGAATFSSNTLNIPNYGSALSGYLPLTGGTLTGALGGTSATFSSSVTATAFIPSGATVPTNGMYLSAANTLNFATASTNRLTISSIGNLGLGVTPSAWAGMKAIQVLGASFVGDETINRTRVLCNAIYDGSYKYLQNNYAAQYLQNSADGVHAWFNAPSGTAGNAITFTQAMTLTVAGNLGIGTTTASSRLQVRGVGTYNNNFSATNATVQIIGDEMSVNQWYPTFNIAMVRQSLAVGQNSFGGIGFTTIDDSNNSGQYDAARIAIINNNGADILTGTSMAFYTQVGSVLNTNPATEQMRITSGGNVLIGTTTNAGYKLDVTGTARVTTSAYFATSSGSVGIGTTSPNALLHVQAADGVIGQILIKGGFNVVTAVGQINSKLDFGSNDGSVQGTNNIAGTIASVSENANGSNVGMAFYTYQQGRTPDLKEAMRLDFGGNLLIGTTSAAGFKLDVAGTARLTGALTGTSATFSSSVTTSGGVFLPHNTNGASITYTNSINYGLALTGGLAGVYFGNAYNVSYATNIQLRVVNSAGTNVAALTLDSGGAAAFASSVTATNGTFYLGDGVIGTYFLGGSGNVARQLKFSTSTTTNAGDTHTIDAQSITGQIIFNTASTPRLTIASTGNVGIGTSSPTSHSSFQKFLHIDGGASLNSALSLSGQNTGGQGIIGYDSSVLYIDSIGATIGANNTITFNTTSVNSSVSRIERMRITSAGNVGIGTSSPTGKFAVNTGASNQIAFFNNSSSGSTYNIISLNGSYSEGTNMGIEGGGVGDANLYVNGGYTSSTNGGIIFRSGGVSAYTERMQITSAGNVGIGGTPTAKLHVFTANNTNGGNAGASFNNEAFVIGATGKGILMQYDQTNNNGHIGVVEPGVAWGALVLQGISGNVLIGTSSNPGYKLYVSGTIYATGNITANSDLTLKKNLKIIDNPIDKLMALNGYAYQWKSDNSNQYGVIAQEVEKILPYAVSTGNDGIKGVSYNQIIPVLIEAIKTQQAEINTLKSKLA